MADCVCCGCDDTCRGSISIEEWREVLCLNPYSTWSMAQRRSEYPRTIIGLNDAVAPCQHLIYEHCHHECTVAGRDQICDAILQADKAFLDYMHYPPAAQPLCTEFFFGRGDKCLNVTGSRPFRGGILQVDHFKVQTLGKQVETHLQTLTFDAATQLSDTNQDALYDKATIKIAKPVLTGATEVKADEIVLYFVENDRGQSRCCRWEIRPLAIKETATEFVITVPAWILVKPFVYDIWGLTDNDEFHVDPQNLTVYPTQLELYRRWVDTTQAVTLYRKPINCSCGRKVGDVCHDCTTIDACIISADQGLIEVQMPKDWNTCGCCRQCVDRLCVHYVAGGCDNETLIARLAASFLQADVCCAPSVIKHWAADYVAVSDRGALVTTLTEAERATVFGTRRGGIEALRQLRGKRKFRISAI